jgi:hypothetical protein
VGAVLAGLVLGPVALAARGLPVLPGEIPPPERARLQPIADGAAVSTRVAAEPFVGRRDVFQFLLDHPEFAAHVTRALRLARYRIWREADGLHLDDGWGAVGTFAVVYASPTTRVMHARGQYRPRLLPSIHGEAVVVIEYDAHPAAPGRDAISAAVTGFVRLDSPLLALASRLVTAVASAKADREAHRLVKVFARASHAIDENPAAVYEQVRQRPDVPPRELEEFRRLLNLR